MSKLNHYIAEETVKFPDSFAYHVRKIGKSHIASGKVCQDYSLVRRLRDNILLLAVADGHGSDVYIRSDRGSRIACECTAKCIDSLIDNENSNWIESIKTFSFKQRLMEEWKSVVLEDADIEGDEDKEHDIIVKYGTTLLFALITPTDIGVGQVGDGAILLFNNNMQGQLVKRHPLKESPVTHSMASERGKYAMITDIYSRDLFSNIILSTDGIYDCFNNEEGFLLYANSLKKKVDESKTINNPFFLDDVDVSGLTSDDCTVAVYFGDKTSNSYKLTLPNEYGYQNITFNRVVNDLEIYRAEKNTVPFELYVVQGNKNMGSVDISSCEVGYAEDVLQLDDGRLVYAYSNEEDCMTLHQFYEYGLNVEMRYYRRSSDLEDNYLQNHNCTILEVYKSLYSLKEECMEKMIHFGKLFDYGVNVTEQGKIIVLDWLLECDLLMQKERMFLQSELIDLNIIGEISCGELRIPLFKSGQIGQAIPFLHTYHDGEFCRILYQPENDRYGLLNATNSVFEIEGTELPGGHVIPLDNLMSFLVSCHVSNQLIVGSQFSGDNAAYQITLFVKGEE